VVPRATLPRMPKAKAPKVKRPRGRPPETLKTEGTFEDVTRRFLNSKKPAGGWPKPKK
jgi:hypothetical protein